RGRTPGRSRAARSRSPGRSGSCRLCGREVPLASLELRRMDARTGRWGYTGAGAAGPGWTVGGPGVKRGRSRHGSPPGVRAIRAPGLSHGQRIPRDHPPLEASDATGRTRTGRRDRSRAQSRKPTIQLYLAVSVVNASDQAPEGEALILISTPAGRLSLLRAS